MTSEENKQLILAELDRLYPQPKPELHFTNPYETLVAVMLSAQCTDKQVNKVTPAVFARFPDVKSMAEADVAELYPLVKSCGFKSKASNIIAACRMIPTWSCPTSWASTVLTWTMQATSLPRAG
jgi:endonuclease-3